MVSKTEMRTSNNWNMY